MRRFVERMLVRMKRLDAPSRPSSEASTRVAKPEIAAEKTEKALQHRIRREGYI